MYNKKILVDEKQYKTENISFQFKYLLFVYILIASDKLER